MAGDALFFAILSFFLFVLGVQGGQLYFHSVELPIPVDAIATPFIIVDSNPAFSYYVDNMLWFLRAGDPLGTQWIQDSSQQPSQVYSTYADDPYGCLAMVNGKPALAWFHLTHDVGGSNQLAYIRANNEQGTSWPSYPQIIGEDVLYPSPHPLSLIVINGYPSILFIHTGPTFVTASDANGDSWDNEPVHIFGADDWDYTLSLQIVDGNPAYVNDIDHPLDGGVFYFRADDLEGNSWSSSGPLRLSASAYGLFPSLVFVDENPAVCFQWRSSGQSPRKLVFVRASNADGSTWHSPVNVSMGGNPGWDSAMIVWPEYPAILYRDDTSNQLMAVLATTSNGSSWGEPFLVDEDNGIGISIGEVGGNLGVLSKRVSNGRLVFGSLSNSTPTTETIPPTNTTTFLTQSIATGIPIDFLLINSTPAISYYILDSALWFKKANDPLGVVWASGSQISSAANDHFASFAIINGKPSVSWRSLKTILFSQAMDQSETSWTDPIVALDNPLMYPGGDTKLIDINGHPAIFFPKFEGSGNQPPYLLRASDSGGMSWNTEPTLCRANGVNNAFSATIVNGNPALVMGALFSRVNYLRSNDVNGSSWPNSNFYWPGTYPSLAIVNGNPGICYKSADSLFFRRAEDPNGDVWGSPIVLHDKGDPGWYSSLVILNNFPFVAYHDGHFRTLMAIWANNRNGSSWELPLELDSDNGLYISLQTLSSGDVGILSKRFTSDLISFGTFSPPLTEPSDQSDITTIPSSLQSVSSHSQMSLSSSNSIVSLSHLSTKSISQIITSSATTSSSSSGQLFSSLLSSKETTGIASTSEPSDQSMSEFSDSSPPLFGPSTLLLFLSWLSR